MNQTQSIGFKASKRERPAPRVIQNAAYKSARHMLACQCCILIAKERKINLVDAFSTCERGRLLAQTERVRDRNTIYRTMYSKGFTLAEIAGACEVGLGTVEHAASVNGWAGCRA